MSKAKTLYTKQNYVKSKTKNYKTEKDNISIKSSSLKLQYCFTQITKNVIYFEYKTCYNNTMF